MTVGSSTNVSQAVAKIFIHPAIPNLVWFPTSEFAYRPAQSVPHDRSPGGGKKI